MQHIIFKAIQSAKKAGAKGEIPIGAVIFNSLTKEILAITANKVEELKSRLTEEYQQAKQKELTDYPIFMAIAENIGYDATGKKTTINELDVIGEELKKFIETL